jgi:hypothetical protein
VHAYPTTRFSWGHAGHRSSPPIGSIIPSTDSRCRIGSRVLAGVLPRGTALRDVLLICNRLCHKLLHMYSVSSLQVATLTPHCPQRLPVLLKRGHAAWEFEQESVEAGGRIRPSFLHPHLLWASAIWLKTNEFTSRGNLGQWMPRADLLDAILIARSTLCQFDSTAATAVREHVNFMS